MRTITPGQVFFWPMKRFLIEQEVSCPPLLPPHSLLVAFSPAAGLEKAYRRFSCGGTGRVRGGDTWLFGPLLYHLSYGAILVRPKGLEPPTDGLKVRSSTS